MRKIFVGNLPPDASEDSVKERFSEFGTVRSISLSKDLFTGRCRGFGFIEMEGHEARAAIKGLDGKSFGANALRVRFEEPSALRGGNRGRAGRR